MSNGLAARKGPNDRTTITTTTITTTTTATAKAFNNSIHIRTHNSSNQFEGTTKTRVHNMSYITSLYGNRFLEKRLWHALAFGEGILTSCFTPKTPMATSKYHHFQRTLQQKAVQVWLCEKPWQPSAGGNIILNEDLFMY